MNMKKTAVVSALFLLLAGSVQDALGQKGKNRDKAKTEQTASDSTVSLQVWGSPEVNDSTQALVKRLQTEGYKNLERSSVDPSEPDEGIMAEFSNQPEIAESYGPYRILGYTDINAGKA